MDDEEHNSTASFLPCTHTCIAPLIRLYLTFDLDLHSLISRKHSTDLRVCLMQLILSLYITQQVLERLILLTSRSVIRSVLFFGHRNSSVIDLHNVLKLEQIHLSFFSNKTLANIFYFAHLCKTD